MGLGQKAKPVALNIVRMARHYKGRRAPGESPVSGREWQLQG
jgi:hypothetical protein